MKITPYQTNAQALKEEAKVLNQQYLQERIRMNCQEKEQDRIHRIHTQFVNASHVDVLV
jgi:hypothetical protein